MKASAKRLLAHLHDKLVLDWRRKAATTADVRATIRTSSTPTCPPTRTRRACSTPRSRPSSTTSHRLRRRRPSVYDEPSMPVDGCRRRGWCQSTTITDAGRRADPLDARSPRWSPSSSRGGRRPRTVEELIDNDEDYAVEFKSTARWDLREKRRTTRWRTPSSRPSPASSTPTAAPCSSASAPTARRRPRLRLRARQATNGDGFVNWLTTHLSTPSAAAVMRTRARIVARRPRDLPPRCRPVVAAGLGQDQQGGPCLLRPHEQLDSRTAFGGARHPPRRPLAPPSGSRTGPCPDFYLSGYCIVARWRSCR